MEEEHTETYSVPGGEIPVLAPRDGEVHRGAEATQGTLQPPLVLQVLSVQRPASVCTMP